MSVRDFTPPALAAFMVLLGSDQVNMLNMQNNYPEIPIPRAEKLIFWAETAL
jgi:hypothetical protein